jgi:hypothetical protein
VTLLAPFLGAALVAGLVGAAPLAASSVCAPVDHLADGDFEASVGDPATSPGWQAFSAQFTSPICSIPACGSTSGTGFGSRFVWFGGALAPENAWIAQSFTVLAGNPAELRFRWANGHATFPFTDSLVVQVDGETLWEATESGSPSVAIVALDLSQFGDGSPHELRLAYSGSTTGAANLLVDDIQLLASPCPPEILVDGFEQGSPAAWGASAGVTVQHLSP